MERGPPAPKRPGVAYAVFPLSGVGRPLPVANRAETITAHGTSRAGLDEIPEDPRLSEGEDAVVYLHPKIPVCQGVWGRCGSGNGTSWLRGGHQGLPGHGQSARTAQPRQAGCLAWQVRRP